MRLAVLFNLESLLEGRRLQPVRVIAPALPRSASVCGRSPAAKGSRADHFRAPPRPTGKTEAPASVASRQAGDSREAWQRHQPAACWNR